MDKFEKFVVAHFTANADETIKMSFNDILDAIKEDRANEEGEPVVMVWDKFEGDEDLTDHMECMLDGLRQTFK